MKHYSIKKIGYQRGGRRLWLEGRRLESAGFEPHQRYDIQVDREKKELVLSVSRQGGRLVTRKERDGRVFPIIDICSSAILSLFEGLEQVRVVFDQGTVRISPLAKEARKEARLSRLRNRLRNGMPLTTGSISTGLGVLSLSLHEGLSRAGIQADLALACDIDGDYLNQAQARNPAFNDNTIILETPLQQVAFDPAALHDLPEVDILEAGIPCTAHSNAGRAKKGLAKPEDDRMAGHLVVGFLAMVAALNPAVLVVENVPAYLSSASFSIMKTQLEEWGYEIHTRILSGKEFNVLENRQRMAMVAVTEGIAFDIEAIRKPDSQPQALGSILEAIPLDSPLWSRMDYLKRKEERDLQQGKGFQMQIFDETSPHVGTIGRGYAKCRSTEAKIKHPTDPNLLRQLTPAEHARCKGIPEELIAGMSVTRAHEVLGQSVLTKPFEALGTTIGDALHGFAKQGMDQEEFRLVA